MRNTRTKQSGTTRTDSIVLGTVIGFAVCLIVAAAIALVPAGNRGTQVADASDHPAAVIFR